MKESNLKTPMHTTKFVPQQTRTSLLKRYRLLDQFSLEDSHVNYQLGLIVAPSGYGKSTLMAQFMNDRLALGETVCWLSLDERDNEEDFFITCLLESYHQANTGRHNGGFGYNLFDYPNTNPQMRLQQLLDLIEQNGTATKIILDDFHFITSITLLESIDWFLTRVPHNLSVYIASKSEPKLQVISDFRAKNNLLDVKANQLNFTLNEACLFLANNKHIKLEKSDIQVLHQKTEGWIAATQLFSLALHNQNIISKEKQQHFINEMSGTDKDIVNYLSQCVFQHQPEQVKHFFISTGILTRFNADLCIAVCGDENAAQILDYVSTQGLFVFELDQARNWFRYHHLFREYLLNELEKSDTSQYRQLAMKAADWFEENHYPEEAIDYYLFAESYEKAAHLISEIVVEVVQYRGNHSRLLKWAKRLPISYMLGTPEIAVCYAWSLLFTRNFTHSDDIISALVHYQADSAQTQNMIQYNVEMLYLLKKVMVGDFYSLRSNISAWLSKWVDAPVFEQGVVKGLLGATCLHTLEFALARKALTSGKSIFEKIHCDYGIAWIDSLYALVHWKQGYLLEAKRILTDALRNANQKMGEYSFASSLINIKLSLVYCDLHEDKHAYEHLNNGFAVIDQHGVVDTAQIGFITKSRLLFRFGSDHKALRALLDGESYGRNSNLLSFEVGIVAEKVSLLLRSGQIEKAKDLFYEHGFDEIDLHLERYTASELCLISLLQARIAFAKKERNTALDILNRLAKQCRQKEYRQLHDSVLLLLASAYYELGKRNQAFRIVNDVVEHSIVERKLGIFMDEKYHLHEVMSEYLAKVNQQDQKHIRFFKKLSAIFDYESRIEDRGENTLVSNDKKTTHEEPLTKRERELLNFLQQGLSNKELAATLFVSESTIKWHLSRIYLKLGAKNRLDAIKIFLSHGKEME
ncbi:hypothetical protein CBF23_000560 [Marinomonas agarivorans]|nr:hypothetical protein CBF23_000560 [Marinomonas agarivorans]